MYNKLEQFFREECITERLMKFLYIYIYIERERERERPILSWQHVFYVFWLQWLILIKFLLGTILSVLINLILITTF
jgi:hypothetical protein